VIRFARALAVTLQILILGELLFIAWSEMIALQTAARVFLYAEF